MMTDRDVWLKAMAVVQAHGTMEAAPVMDTLVHVLGDDPPGMTERGSPQQSMSSTRASLSEITRQPWQTYR